MAGDAQTDDGVSVRVVNLDANTKLHTELSADGLSMLVRVESSS